MSMGASGSVFGLFVVALLSKIGFSLKKLVEAAIISNFVFKQLKDEVIFQASGGRGATNHVTHLFGAAAGVVLILVLSKLPDGERAGNRGKN